MATKKQYSIFKNDQVTSKKHKSVLEIIDCKGADAKLVDTFCQRHDEHEAIKNLLEETKAEVAELGLGIIAEKAMAGTGKTGNIKLQGKDRIATFILQSSSRGLSREDLDELSKKWGKKVVDFFELDPASVKLNSKYLDENDDIKKQFEKAISVLGPDILKELFTPATYKATENAIQEASALVKTPEALATLYADMKLVKSVKCS
jgi:hypothetical protein